VPAFSENTATFSEPPQANTLQGLSTRGGLRGLRWPQSACLASSLVRPFYLPFLPPGAHESAIVRSCPRVGAARAVMNVGLALLVRSLAASPTRAGFSERTRPLIYESPVDFLCCLAGRPKHAGTVCTSHFTTTLVPLVRAPAEARGLL